MKKILGGGIPDRTPFFPTIYTDHAARACGADFEEALINPPAGLEFMLGAALKYSADCVRFPLAPGKTWLREKEVRRVQGRLARFDRKSGGLEGYYDVDGGGGFVPANPGPPVTSVAEAEKIRVPSAAEQEELSAFQETKSLVEKAHEHGLFTVGMCGGQTINFMVESMGSPESALICFYDNPNLARALIEKAVEISIGKARTLISAGVDCVYIGDSYASASVISPEIYEEFCVPAYRRMASFVKSLGVFCYKHCCGNYNPLLNSLPEIGIDAMDGIDPTQGMSVEKTKTAIGGKITLMGGLSCLTLLQGTTKQVYAEAVECVKQGKPCGRYVLGSACAVPRLTPAENMLAAFQAAQDFGRYS